MHAAPSSALARARLSLASALVATAGLSCAARPELPEPVLPLTRTPDAEFRNQPPPPVAPPPIAIPPVIARNLDNGISLQVVERHRLPMASIVLVIRGAGRELDSEPSGIAALCARMLDHGTTLSDGSVARNLRVLGRLALIDTDADALYVRIDVPARAAMAALELIARLVTRPAFLEAELPIAMNENLDRIAAESRSLTRQLRVTALSRLYGENQVRARSGLGESGELTKLTLADLRAFYASRYRAPATALIVVGDVNANRVAGVAARHFGDWKGEPPQPQLDSAPAVIAVGPTRRIVAFSVDDAVSSVSAVVPGPGALHPDYPAFALAATSLAGLALSRGNQALSHHDVKSYGVVMDTEVSRSSSDAFFAFAVEQHDLESSMATFSSLVDALRSQPLTPEELERARARLVAEAASELTTNDGMVMALATLFAHGEPPTALAERRQRFERVTAADVQRVASTWFAPDRVQIVIATNPYEADWLRGAEWFRFDRRTVRIPSTAPEE